MAEIILHTFIDAPVKVCFDLSTSIDLHKISTAHTNEQAIAGVTTGLIKLGESVTWRAKHFGIWFKLTTQIIDYHPYQSFTDEMVKGPFKLIKHLHSFKDENGGTLMTDVFQFESPFGILGRFVYAVVLKKHLSKLLLKRNVVIKTYAENGAWEQLIKQ